MKLKSFFLSIITLVLMYQGIKYLSLQAMAAGDTLTDLRFMWAGFVLIPLAITCVIIFHPKFFAGIGAYRAFVIIGHFAAAVSWWSYLNFSTTYMSPLGGIVYIFLTTAMAVFLGQIKLGVSPPKKQKNIYCL